METIIIWTLGAAGPALIILGLLIIQPSFWRGLKELADEHANHDESYPPPPPKPPPQPYWPRGGRGPHP